MTLRSSMYGTLPTASRRRRIGRRTCRPCVEPLETRNLLTTFVVDTVLDDPLADASQSDGLVSLREAVRAASENEPFGDAVKGDSDARRPHPVLASSVGNDHRASR